MDNLKLGSWIISYDGDHLMFRVREWTRDHFVVTLGVKDIACVDTAMFYNLTDAEEYVRFKAPYAHLIITSDARDAYRRDNADNEESET